VAWSRGSPAGTASHKAQVTKGQKKRAGKAGKSPEQRREQEEGLLLKCLSLPSAPVPLCPSQLAGGTRHSAARSQQGVLLQLPAHGRVNMGLPGALYPSPRFPWGRNRPTCTGARSVGVLLLMVCLWGE